MKTFGGMLKNERGSVLLITVIILMAMTIMGTCMLKMTRMELQMVTNDYLHKRSFYAAESGINYAIAKLPEVGDYSAPDPTWEITLEYDMPSENPNNPNFFEVDIWHKVGENPSTSMEEVIRWGDANGDYKNEENFTTGYPVEYIYAYGHAGPEARRGHSEVEVQVVRESLVIDPKAALYVGGNLQNNGVSQVADGDYNPACAGTAKDIITTSNAAAGQQATDWTGGCGTFCDMDNNGAEYPVQAYAERLIQLGEEFAPGNNIILGDAIDNMGIYYYRGDIEVMNNIEGYGILVVDGNMTVGGNISWHGLVIVTGNSTFNGGGSKEIYGAVITGGSVLGNGSPDYFYDCELINDLTNEYLRYKKRYWVQR
jgi:hypothetical protein